MILYEEDFYKQNTVVHTDTKNASWLKMYYLLKKLGVRNNKFFLALINPKLAKIDPHREDLSIEEIQMVATECIYNPWYYFREIIKIPQQGGQPIPFRLDRATLALLWVVFNDIDAFITVPRQICKTMTSLAIVSYFLYIGGYNTNISLLGKDRKLIRENTSRLKNIRETFPKYMVKETKFDTDNKEGISYEMRKNKFLTFVARGDVSGADNLGRGMTTPIQIWDEFGYFKNNHISYPAAVSATNAAVDSARAAGQHAFNIIATTASLLDTKEGEYAFSLISSSMRFTEKLYDCKNKNDLNSILEKNSVRKMLYITYSYLQLGKTHAWLREKTIRANSTQDQIDTDYLNIWKHGITNSVLNTVTLKTIKDSVIDPVIPEIQDGYIVRWYVSSDKLIDSNFIHKPFILGMDCSENIGRDFTSFVIMDPSDMSIVATCKCNEVNLIKLGRYIVKLLMKFDRAVFIPERNSTGVTILDTIFEEFERLSISPYKRIYNTVVQNRELDDKMKEINLGETSVSGRARSYFGFRTTGGMYSNTRDLLYRQVLKKAISINANKIHDADLADEMCHLEIRNGRIDHKDGMHDDMCFIGSTLIRTNKGDVPISEIQIGDLVLTREGYKPVLRVYKREAEVISKYGFTGTPNHPFITPNGIVEFKNLTLRSKVYVCQKPNVSNIKVKSIIVIQMQKILKRIIFARLMVNMVIKLNDFIAKYGKNIMAKFQKGITYIIKMVIHSITILVTWNVFHPVNIIKNIWQNQKEKKFNQEVQNTTDFSKNGEKKIQKTQKYMTTSVVKIFKDGKNKILNWLKNKIKSLENVQLNGGGENIQKKLEIVSTKHKKQLKNGLKTIQIKLKNMQVKVEKLLWQKDYLLIILKRLQKACDNGKEKIQIELKKLLAKLQWRQLKQEEKNVKQNLQKNNQQKKQIVYNLLVNDCHEYFANDILVHNCIAYLLSSYFIFHANNIHFYGLSPEELLNNISTTADGINEIERQHQMELRKKIQYMHGIIKNTTSEHIKNMYRVQMNELLEQLDDKNIPIDEISKEVMKHQQEEIDISAPKFNLENFKQFLGLGV